MRRRGTTAKLRRGLATGKTLADSAPAPAQAELKDMSPKKTDNKESAAKKGGKPPSVSWFRVPRGDFTKRKKHENIWMWRIDRFILNQWGLWTVALLMKIIAQI